MTGLSTVRSRSKGLSRRGLQLAVLAGAAALPLLSMGITVPAAVATRSAQADLTVGESELRERQDLVQRLQPYLEGTSPEELDRIAEQLFTLIPTRLQPLDEFGEVRAVAAARDLELTSLRRTQSHPTGLVRDLGDGTTLAVVVDEVVITLRSPLDATFGLADDLRAHALPTVVLGFDVARANLTETAFQTELRLGFLRRIPQTTQGND